MEKLKYLDKIKKENKLKKFEENLKKLIEKDKKGEKITEEDLKPVFNFELFKEITSENRITFRNQIEHALEKRCSNYK